MRPYFFSFFYVSATIESNETVNNSNVEYKIIRKIHFEDRAKDISLI